MTIVMVVSILDPDVGDADALPYYRRLEYEIPESTAAMIYLCLMGIRKRYSSFIQGKISLVIPAYSASGRSTKLPPTVVA